MKFANLQIYRLPAPWAFFPIDMQTALERRPFVPLGVSSAQSQGWGVTAPESPMPLVTVINRQMLIKLQTERKLLPASVVTRVAREKAAELEEAQGFAPGKRAFKELKERAADELLPRAFPVLSETWAWIDPVNGWLVVDTASTSQADDVVKELLKGIDRMPLESLRVQRSPAACMTAWLETDEAPFNFTIDQDATMRATGNSKASVTFKRHTLEVDDLRRHIAAGKQCVRLAMTWNDKISFVLDESLTLRSVKALDVMQATTTDFDGNVMLMTGELAKLMADLVEALGGEATA